MNEIAFIQFLCSLPFGFSQRNMESSIEGFSQILIFVIFKYDFPVASILLYPELVQNLNFASFKLKIKTPTYNV